MSDPDDTRAYVARGVRARDEPAFRLLEATGFPTTAPTPFTLHVDVLKVGDFGVMRVHHTALRSAPVARPGVTSLSVVLDGEIIIEQRGRPDVVAETGDIVAHPLRPDLVTVAHAPVVKVTVMVENKSAGLPTLEQAVAVRAEDGMGIGRVLTQLAGSILDTQITPDDPEYPPLRAAVDSAVAAFGARVLALDASATSRAEGLVESARLLLAGEDPATPYTVVSLAAALAFSPQHLRTVFRRVGTSPLAEIRRARAERARALLREAASPGRSREQIAAAAGFPSAAAMRRALRDLDPSHA